MGQIWAAQTSRVVAVAVAVDDDVVVAFGAEKANKTDDDEDRDNSKGIGNYCNAREKVRGCTLARYQSCFLTLTLNQIYLTLATVAVFEIVKMIASVI